MGGGDQVLTPNPHPAGWRHNKEIPPPADVRGAEWEQDVVEGKLSAPKAE